MTTNDTKEISIRASADSARGKNLALREEDGTTG